ncbi:hypothetical protein EOD39_6405 [Acipenser ruthenus]|uniref:Uncharacterized protein n=1 Tax=Acipenser ruthenus TaxID=7906 RepID=A0A662YZF1_ACIRT|nr:hypothetical protein EOD39_6405 [Acipenser ruthenus]
MAKTGEVPRGSRFTFENLTRHIAKNCKWAAEDKDSEREEVTEHSGSAGELASQEAGPSTHCAANGPVIKETDQIVSEPAEPAGVDNEEAAVQEPLKNNKREGEIASPIKAKQLPAETEWIAQCETASGTSGDKQIKSTVSEQMQKVTEQVEIAALISGEEMEGYEEMEGTGTQFKKPKRKRRENIDDTVSVKRSGTEETGSVICADKVKYGAFVREESAVPSLTRRR